MRKLLFLLTLIFCYALKAFSQTVTIHIYAPQQLKGRKAILLTREVGFASTVHSIKVNENIDLQMSPNLVPDMYQLNISNIKGSLSFFLEQGSQIYLDTTDVSRSIVTNSISNADWILFRQSIQQPSDQRVRDFSKGEARARKINSPDSLQYWLGLKILENNDLLQLTEHFISEHPASYVSLYLLKNNWYAFKNLRLFEKLDSRLSNHASYQLLKRRNAELIKKQI